MEETFLSTFTEQPHSPCTFTSPLSCTFTSPLPFEPRTLSTAHLQLPHPLHPLKTQSPSFLPISRPSLCTFPHPSMSPPLSSPHSPSNLHFHALNHRHRHFTPPPRFYLLISPIPSSSIYPRHPNRQATTTAILHPAVATIRAQSSPSNHPATTGFGRAANPSPQPSVHESSLPYIRELLPSP
ncbi:unnamed protein product [Sphenostylis stenocarpa]|uniref:Uncharacterized protein n=1 Tax=Sphenostylis stenocarpa TaxID=92480 RepID=A0AA86VLY7_9FABA|nr:unnamed protein product [Sphenostylis stenocarpa]